MQRLRPFRVHRVDAAAEACRLLTDLGPDAAVYAGGTELLIALKLGLARYEHLVDVKRIDGLRGISVEPHSVRVGAAVTHRELAQARGLPGVLSLLPDVARRIGNPRVRSAGTIGGSLCFGEPRSDLAILATAVGAECDIVSGDGARTMAVEDLVATPYEAALEPGELMTGVRFPAPPSGWRFAYRKVQWDERPLMGLALGMSVGSSGEVTEARVAVGGSDVAPQRFRAAEQALCGPLDDVRGRAPAAAEATNDRIEWLDGDGYSALYKAHLIGVLLQRTVATMTGTNSNGEH
jgi:carbon-monoxide dehydrogenase medium subunit